MEKKYKVQTTCYTYNHESYIKDAMDGFVMQKTTFPVVHVIVDDASTDGTVGMIDGYVHENFDFGEGSEAFEKETDFGHVIYARHKTNRNCYFAVICLRENHRSQKKPKRPYLREWAKESKYIAMCEGDDYWIDPYKLQKQVDFMESHMDFSLCFHSAKVLQENEFKQYINCENVEEKEYDSNSIFPKWIIPTASVLFRPAVLERKVKHREMALYGDILLFLSAADIGKLWGMKEQMSVYRIHKGSVTQTENGDLYRKWIRHEKCLRMNFPKLNKTRLNRAISSYYYSLARNDRNYIRKINDYIGSFVNSPLYFVKKVLKGVGNKICLS